MSIYDINGNQISSGGTSGNFDEKIVNLVDTNKITYGYSVTDNYGTLTPKESACYFDVSAEYGRTYYCNITPTPVAGDKQKAIASSGVAGFRVLGLDENGRVVTNGVSVDQSKTYDSNGEALYNNYCVIKINDSNVVKLRVSALIVYSLTNRGDYDGMFSTEYSCPNVNSYGVDYLGYEYGNNLLEMDTSTYLGLIEKMEDDERATKMLNYKGINPNPIYGKKIAFLGDSNLQYKMPDITTYFKEVYGAEVVKSYAKAGHTWAQSSGDSTATDSTGVGQVNQLCADFVDDGSNIMNDNIDIIIIMLGTNDNNWGTPITSEGDLTTAIGAMDWGLKKLAYYGRNKKIGVLNVPRTNDTAETLVLDETTGEYYIKQAETNKQKHTRAYAQKYCFPIFETALMGRMISDKVTGEYASQNYYFGDGVHIGTWCWEHLLPMICKWVAYHI